MLEILSFGAEVFFQVFLRTVDDIKDDAFRVFSFTDSIQRIDICAQHFVLAVDKLKTYIES